MVNLWKIQQARNIIHAGGIVAHPTEAVYGLACDPLNLEAVLRLVDLKNRSLEKGLILVASSFEQLESFVDVTDKIYKKITASWPGPTTWVLPAKSGVSGMLTGNHTGLAVRVSAHPVVQALCNACDQAIVSSSANVQSSPPARSALEVRRSFGQKVDIILHGSVDLTAKPTEIRNAITDEVIRSS